MTGYVTVRGNSIPESWLWAVGGLIGFLLGVPMYPYALLAVASHEFPTVVGPTIATLLILVSVTVVVRRAHRPAGVRAWAAITWLLATGWSVVVIIDSLPELPMTGAFELVTRVISAIILIAMTVGSALIAGASYELARRWFATPRT